MAYSTIRKGTSNEDVKAWQDFLKSQNYNIATDGIFGNETDNATRDWQTKNGLTADGIVGKNTWASMNTGNNTNTANNNANNTPKITAPKGVDQAVWDEVTSIYTPDDKLTDLKNEADSRYDSAKDLLSQENIIDPSVYDKLGKEWVVPEEVTKVDAWLSEQLAQIQSGKTSWSDKYNNAINDFLNRDKFEYDVDNDQLFQQALASAMNSGKTAMQDTIGQASALTGGYGSTYATNVGNQAYNSFIEDAYNNLPEYYQMALEAYQTEGQEMLNRVNILGAADEKEYGRLVDSYNLTSDHRNRLYDEAYSIFRDTKTDAYNIANLQLGEYGQKAENAINLYDMANNRYETAYAKDYQEWADKISQFTGIANTQQSDYWQNETYEQTERWNQKDLDYKYANLNFEKEQFNYSKGDTNNDGVVDDKDTPQGSDFKLTDTEIKEIRKIYEEKGGGEAGELAVIDYLNQKGKYPDENGMKVVESVYQSNDSNNKKASVKTGTVSTGAEGNNFKTKKNDNFDVYVDGEPYRVENKGKVEDEKLVKKLNGLGVSNKSAFVYDGDAYVKYSDGYYKIGATNVFLWETSGYDKLVKLLQN